MQFKINGYKALRKNLDTLDKNCKSGVFNATTKTWRIVQREALDLVTGPMRAVATGTMRATLTNYPTKIEQNKISGETGYCTPYSFVVHEGLGPHQGNPRPTLVVALINKKDLIVETIQGAIKKEISRIKV